MGWYSVGKGSPSIKDDRNTTVPMRPSHPAPRELSNACPSVPIGQVQAKMFSIAVMRLHMHFQFLTLRRARCDGAMVRWCDGAVMQWCSGAVVQWCNSAVVQ